MEVALFIAAVLLGVCVISPFLGAESRPDFLRPDRKSSFRMVGSMRREDWAEEEFER
jgi:hypothetical protein